MTRLSPTEEVQVVRALASRYLAFVCHALNAGQGRFRNFMSYSRSWLEESGSEDSHGRALWALGALVGRSSHPGRHSLGGHLFHAALPAQPGSGTSFRPACEIPPAIRAVTAWFASGAATAVPAQKKNFMAFTAPGVTFFK